MSALTLRLIACLAMLADHIGFCFSDRYPWMIVFRVIGRIAFPMFVFLIVNGFRHTSSRLRYALRLGVFALISQIPFAMMEGRGYWQHWNVFVTLLLALLAVWSADCLRKKPKGIWYCWIPGLLLSLLCYKSPISCDYGAAGILMALGFYLGADKPLVMGAAIPVALLHGRIIEVTMLLLRPARLVPTNRGELSSLLAIFAMIFICLYNNTPGRLPKHPVARKAMQLSFYLFYPVHMMILALLR